MIMYFVIWKKIIIDYLGYTFIEYFLHEYSNIIIKQLMQSKNFKLTK